VPDSIAERRDARNDAGRNSHAGSGTGSTGDRHHHTALRAAAVSVSESLRVGEQLTVAFAEGKGEEHTVTIADTGRVPERVQVPGRIAVAIAFSITGAVKTPIDK
jgi:hypothetical protein